ncbi:hypothetical protein BJ508DRAFT_240139 [Ascobolus immersus RN42]|uniref:SPRY domain-containing protein n=1 Tax=Ascobolus immersus RN42 TaxID=1160509 RepID=A0A3N4I3R3_ASCIM|nr:hypothetical protein BJ508DRAFT_240139 [Ascobolus immersus RN42]
MKSKLVESAGWQTRTETRIDFHRSCMADHPIPYNMEDFYFEVTIVNLPAISDRKPVVAIGLTNCISPTNCLPGWWNQSIGYHSDDGNVFLGNLDQLTTGSNAMRRVCAVTDVMGCGRHNEQFYFTKNGQLIFICEGLGRELPRRGRYFPMIGFLGGSGDHFLVRTKFKDTPEDPFRFNYSKEGAFVTDGPKWKTSSTTESSGSSMFELQDFFNDLKDDNPSVSAPEDDTSQSVTEGGNQSGSAPNASAPSASAPDGGDQIGSASVDDNQSGSGPEDDSQSVVGAPIHQ